MRRPPQSLEVGLHGCTDARKRMLGVSGVLAMRAYQHRPSSILTSDVDSWGFGENAQLLASCKHSCIKSNAPFIAQHISFVAHKILPMVALQSMGDTPHLQMCWHTLGIKRQCVRICLGGLSIVGVNTYYLDGELQSIVDNKNGCFEH